MRVCLGLDAATWLFLFHFTLAHYVLVYCFASIHISIKCILDKKVLVLKKRTML